jgi:hypothetical protein
MMDTKPRCKKFLQFLVSRLGDIPFVAAILGFLGAIEIVY